jgi:hypothetical protein
LKKIPKGLGSLALTQKSITVLAPTNEAVRRFEERKRQEGAELDRVWGQIYQYHFSKYFDFLPLNQPHRDMFEKVLVLLMLY